MSVPNNFHAVWWKRYDQLGLVLIFTSVVVAPIFMSTVGMTIGHWLFYAMFASMCAATWYVLLTAIIDLKIESDSLAVKSLVGRKVLTKSDVKSMDISVAGQSSLIEIKPFSGRSTLIFPQSFPDPKAISVSLTDWKNELLLGRAKPQIEVFRMRQLSFLFLALGIFIAAVIVGLTWASAGITQSLIIAVPLVLVFGLISMLSFRSYAKLTQEEIVVARFGKETRISWQDVESVELKTYRQSSATNEFVKIKSKKESIMLGGAYDDFPQLRDSILSRVDPSKVIENRAQP